MGTVGRQQSTYYEYANPSGRKYLIAQIPSTPSMPSNSSATQKKTDCCPVLKLLLPVS